MLNNYETMYIIRPDIPQDQVSQEVKRYQEFLKQRGVEDLTIRNHGKKRLAYKIGKHQDGIYVQMNYRVDGSVIAPLQREMRISENVIRFLTLSVSEIPKAPAEGEASPQPATSISTPTTEPATETAPTEMGAAEAAAEETASPASEEEGTEKPSAI
ncbi:MAG: 30S ribosomal protein S6 [Cyanobacteria bacterium SW_9_44_58]|nr:MAG: 30S ribosomal protein S6 [Cyanobacteria bacterium SW_9_44_58]